MDEKVDPFDFVDRDSIDEELEEAIDEPLTTDFLLKQPESIDTDDPVILDASADPVNGTVEIHYHLQAPEEKYRVIARNEEVGLMESRVLTKPGDDICLLSKAYYLVTSETTLVHNDNGYTETGLQRPRDAYQTATELYHQAQLLNNHDQLLDPHSTDPDISPSTREVPPPKKDELFE